MKTKKMSLNKQTIANLNKNEMNKINGGTAASSLPCIYRAATLAAGVATALFEATYLNCDQAEGEIAGVISQDISCDWSCAGDCA